MTVQAVILNAVSGEIHWFQTAAILGVEVRTMRRWREAFEHRGCHALFDRRRQMTSPRRVPAAAAGAAGVLWGAAAHRRESACVVRAGTGGAAGVDHRP
jgi:hypothetical protein